MRFGVIFRPTSIAGQNGLLVNNRQYLMPRCGVTAGEEVHPEAPFRRLQATMRLDMILELLLGGAVTFFVTAYLIYALLRPERF